MRCRRSKLHFLNKAKNLVQQSSHHFRILYFLLPRTRLNSNGEPLPLKPPFCCSRPCICPEPLAPFFPPTPSSIDPSPFPHFFCVYFETTVCLVFHFFSRPSFHFLLFFLLYLSLRHLGTFIRSCTTNSSSFCMTSAFKSFLPSFFVPESPPTSHPQPIALASGPPFASLPHPPLLRFRFASSPNFA